MKLDNMDKIPKNDIILDIGGFKSSNNDGNWLKSDKNMI
jgi:hypothetical protein